MYYYVCTLICIINILICLFRKKENDLQYRENRVCSIATDCRKNINVSVAFTIATASFTRRFTFF